MPMLLPSDAAPCPEAGVAYKLAYRDKDRVLYPYHWLTYGAKPYQPGTDGTVRVDWRRYVNEVSDYIRRVKGDTPIKKPVAKDKGKVGFRLFKNLADAVSIIKATDNDILQDGAVVVECEYSGGLGEYQEWRFAGSPTIILARSWKPGKHHVKRTEDGDNADRTGDAMEKCGRQASFPDDSGLSPF